MDKKGTRFKVLICNVVIMALCVLSIVSYFFMPFWKITVSYALTEDTIESFLGNEQGDSQPESGEDSESGTNENISISENLEIAPKDLVGEDGKLVLSLSIRIKTQDVFSSLKGEARTTAEKILGDNIHSMVDQMMAPMEKLVRNVAKAASKQALKNSVKNSLSSMLNGEKTNEELEQLLNDAGVNDEYINEKVNMLMDDIYSDDATVESIAHDITETVDEVLDMIGQSDPEYADLVLDPADKAEIEKTVTEALESIALEDGTIDINEFLAQMMLEAFGTGEEDTDSSDTTTPAAKRLSTAYASTAPDEQVNYEDSVEELKAKLHEEIVETMPDDVAEIITKVLTYVSYVIFFTFFTWAYLIIKILVKMGMKNNAIKLKLPILLGWIPFFVLCMLPAGLMLILKNPPTALANAMGLDGTARAQLDALSFTFSSASVVSFVVAVFLLFFVLFYYRKLRKTMKQIASGELSEYGGVPSGNTVAGGMPLTDEEFVNGEDVERYENDYDNDNDYAEE